ncbi:hypothetical protein [Kaistia granuli]|uniref:hypothetical protein n=1 Tax=Kaistia granuli TaxID=363259 RepID=UPI0003682749|nr:hypothetical protein [Kaistia granuli]
MSVVVDFPGSSAKHAARIQQRLQDLLDEQSALLVQAGRDMAAIIAPDASKLSPADLQAVAQAVADEVRRLSLEGGVSAERANYFAETVFLSIGDALLGGAA